MNTQQELSIIDKETGEVLLPNEVSPGTVQFLSLLEQIGLGDRSLLLQDTALLATIAEEDRADIMDAYSVEPSEFGKVVNKTLPVIGAAIFEFEPGLTKEKIWHDRYFQCRILVQDGDNLLVIKSSSQFLLRHVAYMCAKYGWFLFRDGPIEYTFLHKGSGFPHYMDRKDKQIKRIIPKSQRKVAE